MQRKIGTEVELAKTVSPLESIGVSSAIDKAASNYLNVGEKAEKVKKLIATGTYNADIAKYILGTLEPVFQGMLAGIDAKEQQAYISYRHGKSFLSNNVN